MGSFTIKQRLIVLGITKISASYGNLASSVLEVILNKGLIRTEILKDVDSRNQVSRLT